MIQVRNSVFETNSSSVHAICVAQNDVNLYDPVVFFDIGDFGWKMDVLDNMDERASYFYTAACELFEYNIADELRDRLEPLGVHCVFVNSPKFEEHEYNGEVHHYFYNGGIDHVDGCKEFVDYLWNDTDALVRFLCNDESFIVTGNDNYYQEDKDWRDAKISKAYNYPHKLFWKGN